jgi:hypothetical protein
MMGNARRRCEAPANAIREAEAAVPPDLLAATLARIERLRARPPLAKSGWPPRKLNRRVQTFGTTTTISTAQGPAARNQLDIRGLRSLGLVRGQDAERAPVS